MYSNKSINSNVFWLLLVSVFFSKVHFKAYDVVIGVILDRELIHSAMARV